METVNKSPITDLVNSLKQDEQYYYYSWQANIAMAFKDQFWKECTSHQHLSLMDSETLHEIANSAAKNFLNLLIQDADNK